MTQTAVQSPSPASRTARASSTPPAWTIPTLISVHAPLSGAAEATGNGSEPASGTSGRRLKAKAGRRKATSAKAKGKRAARKDASPKLGTRDPLLSSYIEALRSVPPFSADEEREAAQELADLEIAVWREVLAAPEAVSQLHVQAQQQEIDATLLQRIAALVGSPRDRLARAHKETDVLAYDLRYADRDKVLMDALICALQNLPAPMSRGAARDRQVDLRRIRAARRRARQSRNRFVNANLRLVISVANAFKLCGVAFVDSIQEGNLGLLKAVDRFDHRRGFRFSTYAHWWIRHCIRRAVINSADQVRVPVHVSDLRRRAEDARYRLRQRFGRDATLVEIAESLDVSLAKLEDALSNPHSQTISLHAPAGMEEGRNPIESMTRSDAPPVDEQVGDQEVRARLSGYLHTLRPVERDVILRRFGLKNDDDQTLDQVSKAHSLSRERVRQIQHQGLAKLRKLCKGDGLLSETPG